jgi:hypothetical protein
MSESELEAAQIRRKLARQTFLYMATVEGWITARSLIWFDERNTDALADVLESMTADEIAEFMIEVVRIARE